MEQKPRKRRSFVAPLVTLLAAIVLAAGSCFGFFNTLSLDGGGKHPNLNMFFLIVFCACAIAFPGTIVWMIARAIRNRNLQKEGGQ